jgi:hypothetical protein
MGRTIVFGITPPSAAPPKKIPAPRLLASLVRQAPPAEENAMS